MNNAVLVQHIYPNTDAVEAFELMGKWHSLYCEKHGFDYWHRVHYSSRGPEETGGFGKLEVIQEALNVGYEYVVWMDADALIRDTKTDLRDAIAQDHIGACWHRIPQLNHWNIGVVYFSNTERIREFVKQWISEYPGNGDGWGEQGIFNRLAMKSDIVQTISDRWNATINYTEVPDAVVLGYHGFGDGNLRFGTIKKVLERLNPTEKAVREPGLAEAPKG